MAGTSSPEACAAFEQSQRLDPQFGTQYNLALCDIELGKLASAWTLLHELARSDTKLKRRQDAADRLAKLEPRVPRIVVDVQPRPAGVHMTVDGEDSSSLIGVELRVDVGDHAVVATAQGYRDATTTVHVTHEGEVVQVALALDAAVPPPAATGTTRASAVTTDGGVNGDVHASAPIDDPARARYGQLLLAGGGVIVAGGLLTGAIAVSDYHSAESCATCDKASQSHSAVVLGDLSTVLVVAGLLPAGAGLYLWKTAHSSAHVTADVSGDRATVMIAGSFWERLVLVRRTRGWRARTPGLARPHARLVRRAQGWCARTRGWRAGTRGWCARTRGWCAHTRGCTPARRGWRAPAQGLGARTRG